MLSVRFPRFLRLLPPLTSSSPRAEWDEPAGQLSAVPVDESSIAPDDRIPRVTSATWKYENGAVGSLTHALVLQGYKYSCELDVLCDGYQLKLIDPYNAPELRVRTPEGDDEQVYTVRTLSLAVQRQPERALMNPSRMQFERDDPYLSELAGWIDEIPEGQATDSAVADDDSFAILSSYADAAKTYALYVASSSLRPRAGGRTCADSRFFPPSFPSSLPSAAALQLLGHPPDLGGQHEALQEEGEEGCRLDCPPLSLPSLPLFRSLRFTLSTPIRRFSRSRSSEPETAGKDVSFSPSKFAKKRFLAVFLFRRRYLRVCVVRTSKYVACNLDSVER